MALRNKPEKCVILLCNERVFMTNTSTTTNAQRQAAHRAKKQALQDFQATEVQRLTQENEMLKAQLNDTLEASRRAKIQYTATVAKLRGQLLAALQKDNNPPG